MAPGILHIIFVSFLVVFGGFKCAYSLGIVFELRLYNYRADAFIEQMVHRVLLFQSLCASQYCSVPWANINLLVLFLEITFVLIDLGFRHGNQNGRAAVSFPLRWLARLCNSRSRLQGSRACTRPSGHRRREELGIFRSCTLSRDGIAPVVPSGAGGQGL